MRSEIDTTFRFASKLLGRQPISHAIEESGPQGTVNHFVPEEFERRIDRQLSRMSEMPLLLGVRAICRLRIALAHRAEGMP